MCKVRITALGIALTAALLGSSASAQEYLTIGASGSGGTYGIIAAAVAKVTNANVENMQMTVESTPGGGRGNVRLLGRGQVDFGLASVPDAFAAWNGTGGFEKTESLRTLLVGTSLPLHLVVSAESGVDSIADLKGKRFVTNSSANAQTFVPQALAAYGLEAGDYELTQYSTTEAIEAFKDGRADAFASFFFMPAAALVDLGTSHDVRLLGMEQDRIGGMIEEHGIYSAANIPAGTYPDQSETVETPAISVAIYSHDAVDSEAAYKVTKAVLNHQQDLAEVYKPAASFSAERQRQQIQQGDVIPPYHDGAKRYFREAGILK